MKYTIEQITQGEDELILKYQRLTQEVEQILDVIHSPQKRLIGFRGSTQVVIDLAQILYIESVDRKTFVYTNTDVFQVEFTLAQLEQFLNTINFFRCSKSMIINIDKITELNSLASNRIDATLCNGEHIIISRTYASDFRKRLKGENRDEE
ncbi:MAG: LytTR family transcriptional regulator DNA-binding domain-containing protein [Lachnospiraceae bacterium]|nr:LytTR family transcriptional regulator DNA-binding domain-containing protein [Lachnospiraceae bacterium]